MDATSTPQYRCTRCGQCCRWPGHVRVTEPELDAIAQYLGIDVVALIQNFTELTGDRRSLTLTERPDGACIMLEGDNTCRINPVKPDQCRDFPNGWSFPGFRKLCSAVEISATEGRTQKGAQVEDEPRSGSDCAYDGG